MPAATNPGALVGGMRVEPMLDPHPTVSAAPPAAITPTVQSPAVLPVPERLTERDRAILGMERREWRSPGAKELAVRTELGLSSARYHQILNALLDSPEALREDPMLVKRLRRIRDARVHARRVRQFRAPAAGSDHE